MNVSFNYLKYRSEIWYPRVFWPGLSEYAIKKRRDVPFEMYTHIKIEFLTKLFTFFWSAVFGKQI